LTHSKIVAGKGSRMCVWLVQGWLIQQKTPETHFQEKRRQKRAFLSVKWLDIGVLGVSAF
jgi:hypothetical protein